VANIIRQVLPPKAIGRCHLTQETRDNKVEDDVVRSVHVSQRYVTPFNTRDELQYEG